MSDLKARTAVFQITMPKDTGNDTLNNSIIIRYQTSGQNPQQKVLIGLQHNSVELTELTPFREYYLNVTVSNKFFKSKGQMKFFKTLEDGR